MISLFKVFVLICTFAGCHIAKGQDTQPMLGLPAPGFSLLSVQGEEYSLEQFKGDFVVIHFATTWCPFCNAEAPYLEELSKAYRDRGVQVLIIDVREEKEVVEKSFARFGFSFPVLLDTEGKVSASYAPVGILPALERYEVPIASNLIIDREGNIRFYSLLNTAAFDSRLVKLQEKLDELLIDTL
jgi:peroxiredoxin